LPQTTTNELRLIFVFESIDDVLNPTCGAPDQTKPCRIRPEPAPLCQIAGPCLAAKEDPLYQPGVNLCRIKGEFNWELTGTAPLWDNVTENSLLGWRVDGKPWPASVTYRQIPATGQPTVAKLASSAVEALLEIGFERTNRIEGFVLTAMEQLVDWETKLILAEPLPPLEDLEPQQYYLLCGWEAEPHGSDRTRPKWAIVEPIIQSGLVGDQSHHVTGFNTIKTLESSTTKEPSHDH
jgi:hypothetical protein